MAQGALPSTPLVAGPQTIVSDAPTGTWVHPRFDEIQRRLNATTFGERQIKSIARNIILIVVSIAIPALLSLQWMSFVHSFTDSAEPYLRYLVYTCRVFALLNIGVAASPLLRSKDDLSDITLTPTQRALLGLQPNSKLATPGSHYITPPRYSRSSTPRSRSGSRSGSPYSDSPLAGHGGTGSYSPSASPLFQKAVARDQTRRWSQGSPSGMGTGRTFEQPSSLVTSKAASPAHMRNSSIGLSSRWIYEKGRSSGVSFQGSYLSS